VEPIDIRPSYLVSIDRLSAGKAPGKAQSEFAVVGDLARSDAQPTAAGHAQSFLDILSAWLAAKKFQRSP
jgi:hypothetical protein